MLMANNGQTSSVGLQHKIGQGGHEYMIRTSIVTFRDSTYSLSKLALVLALLTGCGGGNWESHTDPTPALPPITPIDSEPPTVSAVSDASEITLSETSTITITFSESVNEFTLDDIQSPQGTLTALTANADNTVFTVIFTPNQDAVGDVEIQIDAGSYEDLAGNAGQALASGPDLVVTFSADPPSITSVTSTKTALKTGETDVLTFTFSGPVSDFDLSDIQVEGGTLSDFTAITSSNGTVWTAIFTATADTSEAPKVTIAGDSYSDNEGQLGSAWTAPYTDIVAPTVLTAISNPATISRGQTSEITITFSEPVDSISAIQANPAGTLENSQSADGGIVWTIDYTPPTDPLHGPIELYMGDYEDLAGLAGAELANANGPDLTINYDCYDTASVGEVPRVTTLATALNISVDCANMLIVDNSTLKTGVQTSSDGTDRFISHSDSNDYSFGDSDLNIFTGQVTDMRQLFLLNNTFNADIGYWDTRNVTDMFQIFRQASAFNQNISGWDTTNVTNMGQMFFKAVAFDQPIINWETGSVTNMSYMFGWLNTFNYVLNWDTSSVTNMVWMFGYAHAFNSDLRRWDTSSVTNMNYMFKHAGVFDQDISGWDTSSNPTHFEMFVASPLAAKPGFQPSF